MEPWCGEDIDKPDTCINFDKKWVLQFCVFLVTFKARYEKKNLTNTQI